MKKTIQVTDSYLYHFTTTNHPDGTKTLKVESQWLGAKDPEGLQTRFQATFGNNAWHEIAKLLVEAS